MERDHRRFQWRNPCRIALLASVMSAATVLSNPVGWAQDNLLAAEELQSVVQRVGTLLSEHYVSADVGINTSVGLTELLREGAFDRVTDREALAQRLTDELRAATSDEHLLVRLRYKQAAEEKPMAAAPEHPVRMFARRLDRARQANFGFEKLEHFEGNVGYVDFRSFAGGPEARETASAAMSFLAYSDAIIFDMRENGGGDPYMVQFICSYLFDEPTHLNSLYWRRNERTDEFWTLDDVPGVKMPDVPVFVLTSARTFSGAEEFSYNLQTQKRATLVGEATRGGANPGNLFAINDDIEIFIPVGRAINPVTGTNWEGVGVVPQVAVPADEALDTALELARSAADTFRVTKEQRWTSFAEAHAVALQLAEDGRADDAVSEFSATLARAFDAGMFDEMGITVIGYEFLMAEHHALAIATFKFHVQRSPGSFKAHDSLGEAYMAADRNELAVYHYERSLELNPGNQRARDQLNELRGRSSSDITP
ncbi:MAG: S41 family peptidase [Planctomycetota bacterium]